MRKLRKGPIDKATHNEWKQQSIWALREKYGDGADARLAKAAEFVRAREGLATLKRSGLGSNPQIVLALCERAHELRMKPRARKQ